VNRVSSNKNDFAAALREWKFKGELSLLTFKSPPFRNKGHLVGFLLHVSWPERFNRPEFLQSKLTDRSRESLARSCIASMLVEIGCSYKDVSAFLGLSDSRTRQIVKVFNGKLFGVKSWSVELHCIHMERFKELTPESQGYADNYVDSWNNNCRQWRLDAILNVFFVNCESIYDYLFSEAYLFAKDKGLEHKLPIELTT
jgi:hypothetical protein